MHSVPSHSASKPHDSDYSRNRARSIRFLILLAAILALAFFLSLRAGSYNTPAAELIRGIFGRASDAKINLVIRNNRLPRICTAMVAERPEYERRERDLVGKVLQQRGRTGQHGADGDAREHDAL